MKSGDPKPNEDLKLVLDAKRSMPSPTLDVVSDAARWLKGALKGAGVSFTYSSCEEQDNYGYSVFTIIRSYKGSLTNLDLKIAEIRDTPFVFAEVRSLGRTEGRLFPFFSNLRSDDDRNLLLHYVADFVISTEG